MAGKFVAEEQVYTCRGCHSQYNGTAGLDELEVPA